MAARRTAPRFPDGIHDGHAQRGDGLRKIPNVLSLLVLGGIVASALLGIFGGGHAPRTTASGPVAVLTVETPHTLRSGIFFETRIWVTARAPIADAVIALPPALWHEQTINTAIPQADKEESKDGTFRFHYGKLAAHEALELKFDGQLNPPLFAGTEGSIALLDGERELARAPLHYRVWP